MKHNKNMGKQLPDRALSSFVLTVKRAIRWTALVVGIVILTLVVLVFQKTPPPIVQTTPAAAAELETKLQQADAAITGSSRTLTADQNELNSFIHSRLQSALDATGNSRSSLRDMKLQLHEDRVRIYVLFDAYGKDMTVDFEGKLRTENGLLSFDPISGKIGALPIPRSALQSSMRNMMNSPQSREALRLPNNLSDIHVEGGRIVVTIDFDLNRLEYIASCPIPLRLGRDKSSLLDLLQPQCEERCIGCRGVRRSRGPDRNDKRRSIGRQISAEICRQPGRPKFPLYPSRYRHLPGEVPLSVGELGQLPDPSRPAARAWTDASPAKVVRTAVSVFRHAGCPVTS